MLLYIVGRGRVSPSPYYEPQVLLGSSRNWVEHFTSTAKQELKAAKAFNNEKSSKPRNLIRIEATGRRSKESETRATLHFALP